MSVGAVGADVVAGGLLAAGSSVAAQTVLDGSLLLAVPLALLAGLVSFASPCVLPLVPGYLAYVSGMAEPGPAAAVASSPASTSAASTRTASTGTASTGAASTGAGPARGGTAVLADPETVPTGRLVLGTCLFVAGFSVVFISISMVAGVAGALVPNLRVVYVVSGVVAVAMGLVFMGALPFLRTERRPRWRPAVGLGGAPLLGAAFGVGWIPCVGPTLAAVLGLSFVDGGAGRGALLGAAYCVGLGLPFVLVSLGYARGLRALGPLRRHRVLVQRVGGVLLVVVGLLLITGLYEALVEALRAPISRFPVLL
ncbi:cytochrome c biogenesis CcdA family protein [Aquipuribacter sp. MA13-6]|uniref:cytochrome c biogenesis CcdA family protein n=1 Tax=unclassified Aquipuribacter TaxID=2635084 RepID=UPI003EEEDF14